MRRRIPTLTALVAAAALVPAAAPAASPPAGWRPFAPDSIWNLPLRPDAPLRSDSRRYVGWLVASVQQSGAWINDGTCSMPTFWAAPRTPTQPVRLHHPEYMDPNLIRAWQAVPIPRGARPAACADRNFAVAQTQPDGRVRLWEFWAAKRVRVKGRSRWQADWGGYTDDAAHDRGIASNGSWRMPDGRTSGTDAKWNVTGSSVSMVAGVITAQELAAGRIDHALALATHDAARATWLFPAQRSDGYDASRWALPEGAHLRLDPSLDVSKLGLPPITRMIAEAAQRYGIVVRDRTAGPTVFYTDRPPGGRDRLSPLLGRRSPGDALEAFPWDRLQLLDAPLCGDWGHCEVAPKAVISVAPAKPRTGSRLVLDTSNSRLNQPRADVRWDLDGDGVFETDAGAQWAITVPSMPASMDRVAVQITSRDGAVTRSHVDLRPGLDDIAGPLPLPGPAARTFGPDVFTLPGPGK
ncbi:MAG: hypothetical protein QOE86_1311 [Solirubrobacteraceae bacterium]|nr:hypothetical protein [Solirubrobacteraceae bacterium]